MSAPNEVGATAYSFETDGHQHRVVIASDGRVTIEHLWGTDAMGGSQWRRVDVLDANDDKGPHEWLSLAVRAVAGTGETPQ